MKHRLHLMARLLLWSVLPGPAASLYATNETEEPTGILTLPRVLALAEEHHPALNAARLEAEAAEGRVAQSAARPNPALSVEAENFGGKEEQQGLDAAEYTAQIEQTFELGGKRGKRLQVATAERQLAGFDLEIIRLDIRAETNRRFIGVLGTQARVGLAGEMVVLAEDFLKAVSAQVEAGRVSPMELEKARVLLTQRRITLDQAQRALETARIQLAAQWGSVRPRFERLAGDLLALPAVPPLSALTPRLPGNPDVTRWTGENERARAVVEQAKVARAPDLTVAAGIRRSGETDSDTLVAGVSVPLPIFDRNQGSIREAVALLAKTAQQRRAAEVATAADLAAAHHLFTAATNKASALKDDVLPRVKTVLDAVQSGYRQGKYTYLEVLDAQHTLTESQSDYMDTLISAHTILADLERLVGTPLSRQTQD